MKFRPTVFFSLFSIFTLFITVPLAAQDDRADDEKPVVTRKIIVTAKRLPDSGADERSIPAAVTVISRREIEASSARTVQELLAAFAGINVLDNVGNGIETTIGLRGFSDGNALAVFVNGVRVNEPDNNFSHLEFIDLDDIERIEILPGGGSASRGGGATAGSVNIILRGGEDPGYDVLQAEGGSFGSHGASLRSARRIGSSSYFLSARYADSDGFRDNGASKQRSVYATYRWGSADSDGLELSYRRYTGHLGNPGALTPAELAQDRSRNPYNSVDFADSEENVFSARYAAAVGEDLSFTALGWRRQSTIEVLTTGRSAALYGGFRSTTDAESLGLTVQSTWSPLRELMVTGGVDLQRDDFGNKGWYTDQQGDKTAAANDRDTGQDTRALYGEVALELGDALTLRGGLRHDSMTMDFSESLEKRNADTSFSETSASAGATMQLGDLTVWGRYAQSFQAPTVNDLFAYPFYGSNPDLKPTGGDTWETGLRGDMERMSAQISLYRMDLENEVVFVILDPASFYGRNENVGKSRRFGLEASLSADPLREVNVRLGYAWTKAKNLSLAEETGVDELLLPQVPEHSFSATLTLDLKPCTVSWTSIRVGSQVQGSDSLNQGPRLDAYLLNNAVINWEEGALGLRLSLRNIFDEEYEPRAIYSFGSSYLTPAPGRSAILSLTWTY